MAIDRVTRWKHVVSRKFREHGLGALPVWVLLAQIHTESTGYPRPERHVSEDYPAEGLLQILPSTAQYCGYNVEQVDGLRAPMQDAIRSIDCWCQIQADFNKRTYEQGWPQSYDYPLLWYTGPGTLQAARERRRSQSYWDAWWTAVQKDVSVPALTPRSVYDYAVMWTDAARQYIGVSA